MNTIFEAKSYRVKGISFHPKNPWILTSLHNGEILLYDYVNGILLDKFLEHEGPVRSVNFHNAQPFFVSGGDDCKIKVWNYTTKKCQFNLTGHSDYIRTVQFHHELCWLISSSDDQTIRIWNWLNRTCLATATGHDHYVMSAFFHPKEDLILSASLDTTIRIWDYSVLRKKFYEARSASSIEMIALDITMKIKIEGHERGVNWAVFHPTLSLIASASDDKTIKIWKYTDSKYTDADTLRGHHNNVSSVAFHPKQDYLISNSEDKTIRVWDLTRKTAVDKVTKENDRFWVLGTHPTLNIFASGCDSGLQVFKLDRTYIPASNIGNLVFFYHEKMIKFMKFGETEKRIVTDVKHLSKGLRSDYNSLTMNPFTNPTQILSFFLASEEPNKKIVHYCMKFDPNTNKYLLTFDIVLDKATAACFLSNNKVLTLTPQGNLIGYDTSNVQNQFTLEPPNLSKEKFDSIYQAPLGKIILKFKNGIIGLFDVNTKKILQETNEMIDLKFVVWSNNFTVGALVGKKSIFIVNKNMDILTKIKENSNIKSVCFDENHVLYYTTHFHIKYSLQDGLSGIISSTDSPVYLMMVHNGTITSSDSLQNIKTENFNYAEVRFKISLFNKNYDDVVNILRSGAIHGLKAIENIQNAGFPDLSLKFVNDPKQKFFLALQSGKLEEASSAADILKDKFYYDKLAEKAMMMGKLNIAEICYVKSENWDKLIFFYVITGRLDKLKILQEVHQNKGDNSRRFLNSVYTGNVDEKIKLLTETGHLSLAYLTARLHNKTEYVKTIEENTQNIGKEIKINEMDLSYIQSRSKSIVPLKPIIPIKNKDYHSNWVTNTEIKKTAANLDNILNQKEDESVDTGFSGVKSDVSGFGFNITDDKEKVESPNKAQENKNKIESKWADEEEEDDEEIIKILEEKAKNSKNDIESLIIKDDDHIYKNFEKSSIPGVQIALGNIKMAFNYLKSQIGVISNYEQLKPVVKEVYMSNYSHVKLIPCLPVNEYMVRQTKNGQVIPQNGVSIHSLSTLFNNACSQVADKNMSDALKMFRDIIKFSIFFIATDKQEENTVRELITACTEYIYLTRLSLQSDAAKSEDKVKYAEICCVMTSCCINSSMIKYLILRAAKTAVKNVGNYMTATMFIKKMLSYEKELTATFPGHFDQAKQEYDTYQKAGVNKQNLTFNVNENLPCARNYYCSKTFQRLDNATKSLKCPLCQSVSLSNFKGQSCDTCGVCTLGEEVLGLKLLENYE